MIGSATEYSQKISRIKEAPFVSCSCGCKTFVPAYMIKKVSSLTVIGETELIDIPVYVCSKCGKIPQELMENSEYSSFFNEDKEDKNKKSNLII